MADLIRFNRFNRMLDEFFPEFNDNALAQRRVPAAGSWAPRIDVHEDAKQIKVHAELPGIPKEKVNIDVNNNILTISGENEQKKDVNERGVRVKERCWGRFERSIGLPNTVDFGKVDAKMENGVLEVTLPKTAEAQPKRITVN